MNQPGDKYEQEADRVADMVMRMPEPAVQRKCSCDGGGCSKCQGGHTDGEHELLQMKRVDANSFGPDEAPPIVHEVLRQPGRPLDEGTRGFMEHRMGFDLSGVRVHTDTAAARSASAIGALAYTVGQNVVFGPCLYDPITALGRRLLSHELTHVLQQTKQPEAIHSSGEGWGSAQQSPLGIQRQAGTTTTPAGSQSLSVSAPGYLALIASAVAQMGGRIVNNETLTLTVEPILQRMLSNVTWVDSTGTRHGGGGIKFQIAQGRVLNLELVLNDAVDSLAAGEFHPRGSTDGVMEIFIQRNPTVDELSETVYHEAMHMISWLINRPTPALAMRSTTRGDGRSAAVGTLDLAHSVRQITGVRTRLESLTQSVNARRSQTDQISPAQLDRMARWLVEEVNVRIETEVFRLATSTQQALQSSGPTVIFGTGPNWKINRTMVDHYVFEFSKVFNSADRSALLPNDEQILEFLTQELEGMFQLRVRRRFNQSFYLIGKGILRAQVHWSPAPLTPPSFEPLPLP